MSAPRLVVLAALAAALAGCGAPGGDVRDEGLAQTGPRIPVPQSATSGASTGVGAITPRPAEAQEPGVVYLVRYGHLDPVARSAADVATPQAAASAVLGGPTAAERSLGYRSAIPGHTRLRRFDLTDGVATLDLSAEFAGDRSTVGFDVDQVLALAQLVYTETQYQEVQAVRLLIDGRSAAAALGDVLAASPLGRDTIDLVLARTLETTPQTVCSGGTAATPGNVPVSVQMPHDGEVLKADKIVIAGRIAPGRRDLVTRVIHDGNEIAHSITPGCEGAFRQEIPLPAGLHGGVLVQVYVPGKDGARQGTVDRRLTVR